MKNPLFNRLRAIISRVTRANHKPRTEGVAANLVQIAHQDIGALITEYNTSATNGLSRSVARRLIRRYGSNVIAREKRQIWPRRLIKTLLNPLVLLLFFISGFSYLNGDVVTAAIIAVMIILSVSIRFYQESQAYNAAEALRSLVRTTCTVLRDGKTAEINLEKIVPGDIILLSAGDIVPADARVITSKDLFINQSLLTGESLPVEKHATLVGQEKTNEPTILQNLCFMGTNVESGEAKVVIVYTGSNSYYGHLAASIVGEREITSFDRGIDKLTWLMVWFMIIMVPMVFVINGVSKGNWWEAFLFAISIAVGLTPELLPALVTVNLSKGAIMMSKKRVVVKRLSSIQNLGAMDVLCTDKTGTLTQNKIVLIKHININGEEDDTVLQYAYLNSFYQTGFKNLLDNAVLKHNKAPNFVGLTGWEKIDEIPFDFLRRRLSVVVKDDLGDHLLICKGAVEEVLSNCDHYELGGRHYKLEKRDQQKVVSLNEGLSRDGFRVVAVAYRKISAGQTHYEKKDEHGMVFLGLMSFLDPPKESAVAAISELIKYGVTVKVLTGDNELVTQKICREVGLTDDQTLLGNQIEEISEEALCSAVEKTIIFAKISPDHKRRVIMALQHNGHVVGFLGDGINDAPGLRTADVGISVNTAVDIAKESADIILLEKSLLVLRDGVIEGRKVFGNIVKYIKMGASSNFGNMFSVLGASIFLPFLPMTPLQLILNNLLYDVSQTSIPTDSVDDEYIAKPKKWRINDISRFMLFFGPVSSIFDYITFGIMLYVFHAWQIPALFQTGWFVESLLTQTLIVHVIRSRKIPFLQTRASWPLLFTTALIMLIGIYLTVSPLASTFGFVSLPLLYWPLLAAILFSYVCLGQLVKTWYIKKFGYN